MRDISKFHNFIVIKDFWKIGSICMGFADNEDLKFRETLSRCSLIAKTPLQVVRLGGGSAKCLEIYSEYSPYTFTDNPQDLLDVCLTGQCPGKPHPLLIKNPKRVAELEEEYDSKISYPELVQGYLG